MAHPLHAEARPGPGSEAPPLRSERGVPGSRGAN